LFEPTGLRRDAASVIFNLPGYRVIDAVDLPLGGRRVKVQPVDLDAGCPDCGVVSARVHAWTVQRVRDIPEGPARPIESGQLCCVVAQQNLVANTVETYELDRAFGQYTLRQRASVRRACSGPLPQPSPQQPSLRAESPGSPSSRIP
jgi:hypothetical protein